MSVHWDSWCFYPIYTTRSGICRLRRVEAMQWFCEEGLLPLLERAGYRLRFSSKELRDTLLRVVYTLDSGKGVNPLPTHEEDPHANHHETEYRQQLDTQTWLAFWERWGEIEFLPPERLLTFHLLLPGLVWSWVDLEQSPQAEIVEKEIEEQEYQDELSKGKEDPYLLDTSRREYQDRHWH